MIKKGVVEEGEWSTTEGGGRLRWWWGRELLEAASDGGTNFFSLCHNAPSGTVRHAQTPSSAKLVAAVSISATLQLPTLAGAQGVLCMGSLCSRTLSLASLRQHSCYHCTTASPWLPNTFTSPLPRSSRCCSPKTQCW